MGNGQNQGIVGPLSGELREWRRSLVLLWLAQVFSIIGFGFALPFVPYYVQELGITDPEKLRIWYGIFLALPGISLAIATPVWGMFADRIGRKPMTLRASLGGILVLAGMGFAGSPDTILIMRVLQGLLTGTVTANLTLVVTQSPEEKMGFSIGVMNSAVFAGNTIGPLLGGIFADKFGYRYGFFVSGFFLFLSFIIILIFVREDFNRKDPAFHPVKLIDSIKTLFGRNEVVMVFALISVSALTGVLLRPVYPLLVQKLLTSGKRLASNAGIVNSARSFATVLAALITGIIIDKKRKASFGAVVALLASFALIPLIFVKNIFQLTFYAFFSSLLMGGINPILNTYLSRLVPNEKRGAAYGIAGSAKSMGWAVGGISGGIISARFGLRNVFIFGAVLFAVIALMFFNMEKKRMTVCDEKLSSAPDIKISEEE
ncbi:MAG: multidrug efflux MFS transporter [Spirochaetes bacterium]|nr:multidrug efflux MFS transporter [Spirochaetota bacterium]